MSHGFSTHFVSDLLPTRIHPVGRSSARAELRDLIEGTDAPPPGSALELGCGTGDCSIYLAQHGWQVTAVDFMPKALDKARAKAVAAGMRRSTSSMPTSRIESGRHRSGVPVDRRQRLPAQHERRRSRPLRPRGQRRCRRPAHGC